LSVSSTVVDFVDIVSGAGRPFMTISGISRKGMLKQSSSPLYILFNTDDS
jgi:uncharacterized protein YodC (DUF2158 family)